MVARVPGVSTVPGVRLLEESNSEWTAVEELSLEAWQLPELLGLKVVAEETVPETLGTAPFSGQGGVAVPVVPEVC